MTSLLAMFADVFPAPGLPDPLSTIAPDKSYVDTLMRNPTFRSFAGKCAGHWFMEVNEIAILYWGIPLERKSPPKSQTFDVDDFVMRCIGGGQSHKDLDHRQICQGIALMRKWNGWIGEQKNDVNAVGKRGGKWDDGLPWENENG
jgi:hypothetical protein